MTFEEYNKELDKLEQKIINNGIDSKGIAELNDFKYKHMQEFVDEYKSKAAGDKVKEEIADLFESTITGGDSGSVVHYVETEEMAKAIEDIIWEEIGDFMLDAPEVYQCKYSKEWVIDCMFGGAYIPEWDGTWDYLRERTEE